MCFVIMLGMNFAAILLQISTTPSTSTTSTTYTDSGKTITETIVTKTVTEKIESSRRFDEEVPPVKKVLVDSQLKHEFDGELGTLIAWMDDTEKKLVSPQAVSPEEEDTEQLKIVYNTLERDLRNRKKKKEKITELGSQLIASTRSVGETPDVIEQTLESFNERWEDVCTLLEERKLNMEEASLTKEFYDVYNKVDELLKSIEKCLNDAEALGEDPHKIKQQIDQCRVRNA
ncbi:dystrophin-like [Saccoglossus kowalevskii]